VALDLQEKWLSTRSAREGRKCAIDLEDVIFVDAKGDACSCKWLGRRGSPRQPPHMKHFLESLQEKQRQLSKETQACQSNPNSEPRSQHLKCPESRRRHLSDLKDEALVTAAVSGNSAAFEILFARYHQKMFTWPSAAFRNAEDAEDAVQQAFQQHLYI